jgi:hypothetical protein
MGAQQLNRYSSRALIVMSVSALLLVLYGYTLPPQTDEGAAAHIFQLLIVAIVPTIFIFLTTADWKQPLRSVRALAIPAATLVLAFSALYYLEHVYYR